jgi:hypothetical protein
MYTMYGLAFGSMSLLMAALNRHVLRTPVSPPLDEAERAQTRREIVRWLFSALVAAGSIVFAMHLSERGPNWMFGMPGMFYALLGFTGPVVDRFAPLSRRPAG